MLESSHIAFAFDFQTCSPISKSLWSGFIFSSSLPPMSRHIQKERERERERTLWACRRQTQWKCSLVYVSTEPSHAINHVFVWTPIWVRSCFNNKLKMHWGAELVQKSLSIEGLSRQKLSLLQTKFQLSRLTPFWEVYLKLLKILSLSWIFFFFEIRVFLPVTVTVVAGALVLLLVNNAAWNSSESECVRDLFAFSFVFWFLFPESVFMNTSQ